MLKAAARRAVIATMAALPDKTAVAAHYFVHHRRLPALQTPTRFTEKVQYRKLHDRDPNMAPMMDKATAKEIVAAKLSADWIIPTLFVGESIPSAAERSRWPIPYVVKATHGSGWNRFVRQESDAVWSKIGPVVARWLSQPYAPWTRQWPYSQIKPRLLVEPYVGARDVLPVDYKFWVFDGRVAFLQVDTGRATVHKRTFYDLDWKRMPFRFGYPDDPQMLPKPASFDAMVRAAGILGAGFPFARVDLYEINGQPKFGEVTFFPDAGVMKFEPDAMDAEIGRLWPD